MSNGAGSYTQRFFALLELLKSESDEMHQLQQKEIVSAFEEIRKMHIDRRTVKKALEEMMHAGYPVVHDKGWYYKHELTQAEIGYLSESIRFNNTLTQEQQSSLLIKLAHLGSKWNHSLQQAIELKTSNEQFLYTLDVLHSAIAEGIQVDFYYGNYDVDYKLHPRVNRVGNDKLYVINLYQIAVLNGRYYLIANVQKYSGLSHYRIDRIMDIKRRRRKAKPLSDVDGNFDALHLPQYLAEHPYMYSGTPQQFRIRVKRTGINDIFDWFGTGIRFENTSQLETDALVACDKNAIEFWTNRYKTEVISVNKE